MNAALPGIAVHDDHGRPMLDYVRARPGAAAAVMETVIRGLGPGRHALRPLLPMADRVARRRLVAMGDPYLEEIEAIRDLVGRPGPIAFSLSYEFGCTARVFETGGAPVLFRTLDWPFRGLGELVEMVHLPGDAGPWVTATWPGVVGVLTGAAPGRFAAALNQAPERRTGFGRAGDWLAGKRRFLRATGLPPAHLLRRVFETAPDFATARQMLTETPVAAPVIYTLAGTGPGEACTIERTEDGARHAEAPAAANHFAAAVPPGTRWRARGIDSEGRRASIMAAGAPWDLDDIPEPVLNDLTRLAVRASANGDLAVAGYDGLRQVTAVTRTSCAPVS